jgi:ketosteroid isomerase-like protein
LCGQPVGGRRIPAQVYGMPAPDIAIRAKRKLTNRLIAAHDAARLRPHLTEDVLLIVGDGGLIQGVDAVVAAFAGQFADSAFVAYVRRTETVELASDGHRAAETGRWVGSWKGGVDVSGVYMAAWRQRHGQWLLERELYITLTDQAQAKTAPPLRD